MLINSRNDSSHNSREDISASRGFSDLLDVEQVGAASCTNRPVVVLSGSVNVVERLLLEKCSKAELGSNLFDDLHDDHVLIDLGSDSAVERGKFVLVGRDLTVPGTKRNSKLEALALDLGHASKGRRSDRRRSHVVVAHFLATRSILTNDGASGHLKVNALQVDVTWDKEDLLLQTDVGLQSLNFVAHEFEEASTLTVESVSRAEKRSFLIQSVSVV
mmetsp:Transcript_10519/g.20884  ORF Transcript_10519/g.20884 Transcript_10519/m.20884 type:complete len:217 (+) Transcript_10519:1111-1761(+)